MTQTQLFLAKFDASACLLGIILIAEKSLKFHFHKKSRKNAYRRLRRLDVTCLKNVVGAFSDVINLVFKSSGIRFSKLLINNHPFLK